jgi:hypothetical protein
MGRIIIPPSARNVQLTEKEQTCVYISTSTGRILGFGHESMRPLFREGWKREVLKHAADIDRWANQYAKQEEEDRQAEDYLRTERERSARNAIRQALIDRRSHVDAMGRAYIDANLKLMDMREERARHRKQQACLLTQMYEADKLPEDIALDCPAFKAAGK